MIAEASTGEESALYNLAGDQIGVELRTRRWYDYIAVSNNPLGWATVFRVDDPAIAERIATFMEKVVCNGHVGYDQNGRGTLETALFRVGYDPSAVHTSCETDCSMTAYEAVKYATGIDCPMNYEKASSASTLPSTRDAKTGLCGETYFGNRSTYPVGTNFHYYMTRVLPLNGIKTSVYTLSGWEDDQASTKVQRSDFRPRDLYQCVWKLNGVEKGFVLDDSNNRRLAFTAPYWKTRYYETPYERIGITPAEISAGTVESKYIKTIGGVKYYNELARAVDKFSGTNGDFSTSNIPSGATTPTDKAATAKRSDNEAITQSITLGWKKITPCNALTAEQIQTLNNNLTIHVDNRFESGHDNDQSNIHIPAYLKPKDGETYPKGLKRGDLILTRTGFWTTEGYYYNGHFEDGGYTWKVKVPRYSSAGHIAVWI